MSVTIPWPPKELSPNARKDRREISSIRARYRHDCGWLVTAAKMNFAHMADCGLHMRITFHPPDNRKRDLDNMLASIKSGLDGVSDAMGVDDSKWGLTIRRGDVIKGGAVVVEAGYSNDSFVPYRGQIGG